MYFRTGYDQSSFLDKYPPSYLRAQFRANLVAVFYGYNIL